MFKLFEKLEILFDRATEAQARKQANTRGRRSFIGTLGKAMVGSAVIPMLPFDRWGDAHAEDAPKRQAKDETECDYWRFCALSGNLCTCCGGTLTMCPTGTEVSKVSWIGTCENPDDGKSYLVSYNDCCGKLMCSQCACEGAERARPGYRLGLYNHVNWCMANNRNAYHCTITSIVGLAGNH